jgi:hypothetical protein
MTTARDPFVPTPARRWAQRSRTSRSLGDTRPASRERSFPRTTNSPVTPVDSDAPIAVTTHRPYPTAASSTSRTHAPSVGAKPTRS